MPHDVLEVCDSGVTLMMLNPNPMQEYQRQGGYPTRAAALHCDAALVKLHLQSLETVSAAG